MKVRKGQNSIKLPSRGCNLDSAVWEDGSNRYLASKLMVVSYEDWLAKRNSDSIKEVEHPLYVAQFDGKIYFHPPAPCAGEIRVRYSTLHEI